jgi:putative addiction module CopG family antidote
MTLAIKPELERKIADMVKSGRYASVDDVVANALAELDRAEAAERLKADIRAELDEDRAQAGEGPLADAAVARLWDRINRWRRERHETV